MPSVTGILNKADRVTGQRGDFARLMVNGETFSIFPPDSEAAFKVPLGSTVTVEYVEKNKDGRVFKNAKSVTIGPGNQSVAGGSAPVQQSSAKPSYTQRDPAEVNTMMVSRYALDYMLAKGSSAAESVKTVLDIVSEVKNQLNPTVSQKRRPVSSFDATEAAHQAIRNQLIKIGIAEEGDMWERFLFANYKSRTIDGLPLAKLAALQMELDSVVTKKCDLEFVAGGDMAIVPVNG